MNLELKESVVLVTGSSSGIGKAAAIAFGEEGARVAVTYHANRQGAEDTASKVRDAGGQALVMHYDLADPDSIRSSIQTIEKEWGTLNVLVNNAAPMEISGPTGQLFEEVPLQNWEAMLRKTLEGVTLTIQCALPLLRQERLGADRKHLLRRNRWLAGVGAVCDREGRITWVNPHTGCRTQSSQYSE